jgi:6-phosphogluconolactonase/glucosamine-6-phosphate isomerase/deaminase
VAADHRAVSPGVQVAPDPRALARRAAEWLVERTRAAVAARGGCAVALAGGSTPRVPATGPKPPLRRMTVTPPVIEPARAVLVLVAGAGKAAMLARVLEGPLDARAVPVQLARDRTWIVNAAAASGLTRP